MLSRIAAIFVALSLALGGVSIAAQAAEPPPLAAYGALPEVEDAAISPDGSKIVVLATLEGIRSLLFYESDMTFIKQMSVGELKVRSFRWIGNDRILLLTSQTEDLWGFTTDKAEFTVAQVIPIAKNAEVQTVFGRDKNLSQAVFGSYGTRKLDGDWNVYFGAIELRYSGGRYTFNHGRPYLYRYDVANEDSRRVSLPGRENTYRTWLLDANGEVAATLDLSRNDGDWTIKNADDKRIASGRQSAGSIWLIGLGYDGTTAIYAERDERNLSTVYEVTLADGTVQEFLPDTDFERLYFDERTGHLIGYVLETGEPVFRNPAHRDAVSKIRKSFRDLDFRMVDWTPDFDRVLIRTSGNGDSGTWFMVDLESMTADGFASERLAIAPEMVGPISTFTYTAGDGLELDGILTLPPGRDPKNLPVIMLPHGGPHAHDREQFDWWAQAFASRGYAVFQPNFRGSTNRDQAFKLAGYGQWGRAMQTDISDGLAALAEAGIVDPQRACIVGASYGGYAALAGVTLQQGIYRCAVAVAPVSDLSAMYDEEYRASGEQRILKTSLLQQLGPKDGWKAVSPRRHADRADAPIMLIHGEDDTVVPFSHSYQMADKLKDHDKPYELVKLEGEDHWLSLSSTRLQMLTAAVRFVEEHNPPD